MIGSLARRAAAASSVLALGGLGALALQAPAHASSFSASYTCNIPLSGSQAVTISGTLTASPSPSTTGTSTHFALHISNLSLSSPVAINSWTATAGIDVTGAQTASFQVSGSGGRVPANQPITGDLAGNWTPTVAGTDQFQGGNVTVKASVPLLGTLTVPCTPNAPRPVAETLTVN
ncbi:hypothetical protein [Actinomadura sp. DC4]|uniref:hypothetical protein n=1 Tax=Actinomadura sp. DC4 TaxID=3055069 RepID=UPI0025B14F2D|nr:hypothetical protein [Actinomadura sp. DC4]MDN3359746.1 hypothetical protein [Actinomadura sp. DC4]